MNKQQRAMEKELMRLYKQERAFLEKRTEKKDSALNRLLAEKVPEKLQATLDAAFAKAFALVFEKGTAVIEKSCGKEEKEKQFQIDSYAAEIKGDRRSLRAISRKAGGAGRLNLALSGAAGIGLGLLGVGLPDIALFTALMLRGIYEIALRYGFSYESETERQFILLLISGAVACGEELKAIDEELNAFIQSGSFPAPDMDALIRQAAGGLSKELLVMKFLQGVPLVGAVGGAYDAVYMKRVMAYAELKYRRRFYYKILKKSF